MTERHRWSAADDKMLMQAMKKSEGAKGTYGSEREWWDAVSTVLRVAGGPVVTGDACKRRAGRATKPAAPTQLDRIERMLEALCKAWEVEL